MTLAQFNNYLKENITDEMFESLVLDYLKDMYEIRACKIDGFGNKEYTLQDSFVGDEYYLIINLDNAKMSKNYSFDKYMIANKDEATLFLLANHIWGEQPRLIPVNARCLLSFVNKISDNPTAYFGCRYADFAERINNLVKNNYSEREQYIEELYNKCVDKTIALLMQEGYLSSEKDWNRKNHKIKLTGEKGENRACECYVCSGTGCVFFTAKDPYYPLHYYLNNEKDIPLLANQIVQLIKEKRTF